MLFMGRNPIPTKLKQLAGNPGKRKLNDREPQPRALDKDKNPYPFLAVSKKATFIFRTLLENCPNGLISVVDEPLLARYSELLATRETLILSIRRLGRTYTDGKGNIRLRPEVKDLQNIESSIKDCESQLGFTPSARSKVVCIEEDVLDELDAELFS